MNRPLILKPPAGDLLMNISTCRVIAWNPSLKNIYRSSMLLLAEIKKENLAWIKICLNLGLYLEAPAMLLQGALYVIIVRSR
jgi:hypothetical protein